jgi:hypothetical protein
MVSLQRNPEIPFHPPLQKGSCEKIEELPSELHKSPLTPLLQRGELGFERAAFSITYGEQLYYPSSTFPPWEKGGRQGDLKLFHSFRGKEGDLRNLGVRFCNLTSNANFKFDCLALR